MIENIVQLEGMILLWIQQNLRQDWLTPIVRFYTKLGNIGFIWLVLCVCLLVFKKTRLAGAAGILALFFSLGLNNVFLKNLVARTRPYEVIEGLQLIGHRATDYSFPSGHSGCAFSSTTAICAVLDKGRIKWILIVMAALMALSRLYVGIHYPTDVICGSITGILCGLAAAIIMKNLQKRRNI